MTNRGEPSMPSAGRLIGSITLILAVTAVRSMLDPVLGYNVPFILFFPSVMLIAWFAGTWCAIVATVLAAGLAAWLFVPTSTDPLAPMRIVVFIAGSALIIWVSHLLHRNRRELIDAHRRAETQRRQYEVMLDSIAEGVIGIDTDNAIVFLNHAARTLTGVGAVALGKPLLEVLQLTDDSSQQPASDLAALKQTGRNWTIQAADQKPVPLAISISKMRSDQEDAGTVLVLRVATDERERERMVAETESARARCRSRQPDER